ncbi:hypothetical protein EV182_001891 [Spiromyces aspiralis]|uniref:Uncharacterized protein n=1 Tax=Spiromyces aspiralis TaxID=68401 RepID=A0ACC1HSH7_9FUNG|nr:hypothetical protein EV182_001891 [Spiromyces aspiralis]
MTYTHALLHFEKLARQGLIRPGDPEFHGRRAALVARRHLLSIIRALRGEKEADVQDVVYLLRSLDLAAIEAKLESPDSRRLICEIRDVISTARRMLWENNRSGKISRVAENLGMISGDIKDEAARIADSVSRHSAIASLDVMEARNASTRELKRLLFVVYKSKAFHKFIRDLVAWSEDAMAEGGAPIDPGSKASHTKDTLSPSEAVSELAESGKEVGRAAASKADKKVDKAAKQGKTSDQEFVREATEVVDSAYKHGMQEKSPTAAFEKGREVAATRTKAAVATLGARLYDYLLPIAQRVRRGEMSLAEAQNRIFLALITQVQRVQSDAAQVVNSAKERLLSAKFDATRQLPDQHSVDALIDRVREFLMDLKEEPAVMDSVTKIFKAVEQLSKRIARRAELVKQSVVEGRKGSDGGGNKDHQGKAVALKGEAQDLFDDVCDLTAQFAGGRSLDKAIGLTSDLAKSIATDKVYMQAWVELKKFFEWAVDQDLEQVGDEFKYRARDVIIRMRRISLTRYRDQWLELKRELWLLGQNIRHDVYAGPFIDAVQRLYQDVVSSVDGQGNVNPHSGLVALGGDLKSLALDLVGSVNYVAMPRLQGGSEELEFRLDNFVLPLKRCMPEHVAVSFTSDAYPRAILSPAEYKHEFSPYNHATEQYTRIHMRGLHLDARDVAFYLKKSSGRVRIEESGLADIVVGGRGMDVELVLRRLHDVEQRYVTHHYRRSSSGVFANQTFPWVCTIVPRQRERRFVVEDVSVDLHDLSLSVRETRHDWTYGILLWLFKGTVRNQVTESIRNAIITGVEDLDAMLAGHMVRLNEVARDSIGATTQQIRSTLLDSQQTVKSLANSVGAKAWSSGETLVGNTKSGVAGSVVGSLDEKSLAARAQQTLDEVHHKPQPDDTKKKGSRQDKKQQQQKKAIRRDSLIEDELERDQAAAKALCQDASEAH